MKILITGNKGYVGSVLVPILRTQYQDAELIGFDNNYFAHLLTTNRPVPEVRLDKQIYGDIRTIEPRIFHNVDIVIHLAAISNDPMGNNFEIQTSDINFKASERMLNLCVEFGVKHLIFASSCSIYGAAGDLIKNENSTLSPLTSYAKSKVYFEEIGKSSSKKIMFTALRFATACGMSPRLRLDLVLNDFVATAIASSRIELLSNGKAWRPLIDVRDMSRAIVWACKREDVCDQRALILNVGNINSNYEILELANIVSNNFHNVQVQINSMKNHDNRSYKVDFSKYYELAGEFVPEFSVQDSIKSLIDGLNEIGFNNKSFRNEGLIRLNAIKSHISNKYLTNNLVWI